MKARTNHRGKKIKTFVLFLILACIIWVLTKFSNQDTSTITAQLVYTDLPPDAVLLGNQPKSISFDLTANGFDFLLLQLKRPTIAIEVNNYYNEKELTAVIDNTELVRLITNSLNTNIAARNLSIDMLTLKLDALVSKKIAVELKHNLEFEEGFRIIGTVTSIPDSVVVQGTSSRLESINLVSTKSVDRSNISGDLTISAEVDTTGLQIFSVNPEKVDIAIDVEEFTQKEIILPIELINVPEETTIKLIPETIRISADVPVNKFNTITTNDFRVVCDYLKRNEEENFMLPELVSLPEDIHNVEFGMQKIDFLIFKQ